MSKQKPKILYLDVENSQMVVEFPTYSLYNIDKIHPKYIKHDWFITCAAWGWLDNERQKVTKIESSKVSDFPKAYKKDFRDDYGVIKKVHEAMSQADLIIGHNSDAFDLKKLNYRFIKHGLAPLEPRPTVDTLKAARKYAKASSNSLYYLAKEFGVPMKVDLPQGVMHAADAGCKKSLDKLSKYNRGDIISGAALYFKLLPFIKNHPNINKIMGKTVDIQAIKECGSCGSKHVIKNGFRASPSGRRQRYICLSCGSSTLGVKIE
jgi:DNA polymerase elongation subunit (family B)